MGNWHYSPKLCQGLLFFILQSIFFIPFVSQNVLEGKYVNRYFNKKINRCIISRLLDSQICNVGHNLLPKRSGHQICCNLSKRDLTSRKFKVIFTKSSFHYKSCVYVFNMLFFFKFAGNVIKMQFSPVKLPPVHDPQSIKRLHTYSHMKIKGGMRTDFQNVG